MIAVVIAVPVVVVVAVVHVVAVVSVVVVVAVVTCSNNNDYSNYNFWCRPMWGGTLRDDIKADYRESSSLAGQGCEIKFHNQSTLSPIVLKTNRG